MKSLKAKKVNMTQIFSESGEVFPVTLVVLQDSQELSLKSGDIVTVSGISKGKGFQGVVKRHKFGGGRRSHGQKHSEREAGSVGGGGRAGGRIAKGMRMAGRMGADRVTTKNLKIIKVLEESKEIFIGGSVPGRRGSMIEIRPK